ncbi:cupin domain-containing protein [Streptomyces sp. NPDC051976]|uniref:cupin domain-containing protein n=1 Tax=Streptomyces sp. NPDC051976 TaxID=3154947 RepID=UPI003429E9DF
MESARVVRLGEVVPITYGGGEETRFLLRAEDTGGSLSCYEVKMPAGEGSVWHVHHGTDESFYVLDGEFEVKVGDEIHKAPAGTMVFGPRGVPHSFYNVSDRVSTMVCTMTPGGIELFFEELSEVLTRPERPGWEEIKAVGERHHISADRPQGGPHGGPPVTAAS